MKSKTAQNIVYLGKSLDGYIAGKNNELDWLDIIPIPEGTDMGYYSLMDRIDALLMGRNTFEVVCGFGGEWPYQKPVFVLSNSLKAIPEAYQGKVELVRGRIREVLDQLHQRGFFKLYIDGGKTVQAFLKEDLIDEMTLTTIPILLGGGIRLFGAHAQRLEFELVKSEVFAGHIVQSQYRRKRT